MRQNKQKSTLVVLLLYQAHPREINETKLKINMLMTRLRPLRDSRKRRQKRKQHDQSETNETFWKKGKKEKQHDQAEIIETFWEKKGQENNITRLRQMRHSDVSPIALVILVFFFYSAFSVQ